MIEYIEKLVNSANHDLGSDLKFGPVEDETTITSAEIKLGAIIPKQYRNYLLSYSGGMLLGWEMAGFPNTKSRFPAFVDAADEDNLIMDIVALNQRTEQGCIEFTHDGRGYYFAFIPDRFGDAVCVSGYGLDWQFLYKDFYTLLHETSNHTAQWPTPRSA